MTARIYRPARNAMQSGKGNSRNWVLVYEPAAPREIDPLMGYISSGDTRQQVQLNFETQEQAETYAQKNGIAYVVQPAHDATVQRASYPDNFRSDRRTPWTH
ncbi:ETC complex I subunit [Devosia sp.]|uniref:ETC complex I subunit n=1 Tax=Devosia sp. TaxID=1871048 RepID=UPI00086950F8|nr:ETC complex I subunit [Devosia sp.]ODT81117.1 MAG: ETC complex I subunit [Pelagibacterium sp. SCN 64-44]